MGIGGVKWRVRNFKLSLGISVRLTWLSLYQTTDSVNVFSNDKTDKTPSTPSAIQFQSSPEIQVIPQLSWYNELSAASPQSVAWNQYQASAPKSWSIPWSVHSYPQIFVTGNTKPGMRKGFDLKLLI